MIDPLLEPFRRDKDPRLLEPIAEAFRPLVLSVCGRYLWAAEDVNDAVQETFLRFVRSADRINGSLAGWFAATAHAASVDLIRKALRAERHHRQLRHLPTDANAEELIARSLIQRRLTDAMAEMDAARRALLVARFFRREPLRMIAGQAKISVATASRRVQEALGELAGILRGMGLHPMDAASLGEQLSGHGNVDAVVDAVADAVADVGIDRLIRTDSEALRFAPDWSATDPYMSPAAMGPNFPGWSRPIRVGVLVSHLSISRPDRDGRFLDVEAQALSVQSLGQPGVRLVGIVESGTSSLGPIERTLRTYELVGGLIDAADPVGLATLDVIIIGINFQLAAPEAQAINRAVRGGVGLLNEWWTGNVFARQTSGDVMELMLATPPVHTFHTKPHCGTRVQASVAQSHALIGDVPVGATFIVAGCGPAYREAPGARVLALKPHVVQPDEHGIAGVGPLTMPVWTYGTLGEGRVIVANVGYRHDSFAHQLHLEPRRYFENLILWLAEPKRGMG